MTQMLLNQAMSLHQQGQLAEAGVLYQQVLAAGPHYQAQYLLAVLFYQQQRLDEDPQIAEEGLFRPRFEVAQNQHVQDLAPASEPIGRRLRL